MLKNKADANQPRPLKVFLCHSSRDKLAVRDLYQKLIADGFEPWLDENNLLPGQEWEREIRKAVRKSDVVIVCLSQDSVSRSGFVHKEIKYALDIAEEQPEGTIFIIPLKLEPCEVPERLQRWHWANLFDKDGYNKLCRALSTRQKSVKEEISPIELQKDKPVISIEEVSERHGSYFWTAFEQLDSDMKKWLHDSNEAPELHIFWICDTSGSMAGSKIQSLNLAIRKSLLFIKEVAMKNIGVKIFVCAIKFSNRAEMHIAEPTPISNIEWIDLEAGGVTDMGYALSLLAKQLSQLPLTSNIYPPILILISDGWPTDDFSSNLKLLMDQFWGKQALRLAIAIGHETNQDIFQNFIGHPELKPFQANSETELIKYIDWISTSVLQFALNIESGKPFIPIPLDIPILPDNIKNTW